MKIALVICPLMVVLGLSCSKSSNNSSHEVRYDVTATNYTSLHVSYTDETGQTQEGNYSSGWTHSFTVSTKGFVAKVEAFARNMTDLSIDVTATVKITVDGTVAKTNTNTAKTQDMGGDPLASATYTIQ